MIQNIHMLLFDIDGVLTDGRKYIDGKNTEIKSVALKDLDALVLFRDAGYKLGCITGEDNAFSNSFVGMSELDYVKVGCKEKDKVLIEIEEKFHIISSQICYIGDGKYDISLLKKVGLAVCPHDAIQEVKNISAIILDMSGGQGCIAELYTRFQKLENIRSKPLINDLKILDTIKKRINEHNEIVNKIYKDYELLNVIQTVCQKIIKSYKTKGQLFLCGNGGSAADAQHIAAELVGKFYLERKAYSAEALSTNTSIITALANDYNYNMIFARQMEAKGKKGDVLIGITTSGKSPNIFNAFKQAKVKEILTVLMTGEINSYIPIIEYTDYVIKIPSDDTARIQEGHILIGHILCEIIELELSEENKNEQ